MRFFVIEKKNRPIYDLPKVFISNGASPNPVRLLISPVSGRIFQLIPIRSDPLSTDLTERSETI